MPVSPRLHRGTRRQATHSPSLRTSAAGGTSENESSLEGVVEHGALPETLVSMAAGAEPDRQGVIVYVRQDNLLVADLGRAERTAARILASIGVAVKFRAGAERKPNREGAFSIELQLDAKAPAHFHSGAMAYALPFGLSGTRIHVYCDRVRSAWPDTGAGTVLGHVMAHEIAHVLEGASRHSAEGVMKARWGKPGLPPDGVWNALVRPGRCGLDPCGPGEEGNAGSVGQAGATLAHGALRRRCCWAEKQRAKPCGYVQGHAAD